MAGADKIVKKRPHFIHTYQFKQMHMRSNDAARLLILLAPP
ncbi:hypothetical Protein YC6258_04063 [Gynuella sunshinyii YC6258]|uniref:Uncharacterized protein n=1 Tax=Gynuella sunshinyii YC6258 TaxID=1445510 RepID=A0A0C5W092_9GAMM|nr:hypothetical Protein YC6258_04063 [Gynuella sunshinyii YC6258]